MKSITLSLRIFFLVAFLAAAGCESQQTADKLPINKNGKVALSLYSPYLPVKIDIMPLTEFICIGNDPDASQLKLYVGLLDSFGSQIKAPAVFRFELYGYEKLRAEPKGKRIVIWPDIDLTEPGINNEYWRDFLRAYQFNLDFEPLRNQNYILQATCLCPNGRRLSADFTLKCTN